MPKHPTAAPQPAGEGRTRSKPPQRAGLQARRGGRIRLDPGVRLSPEAQTHALADPGTPAPQQAGTTRRRDSTGPGARAQEARDAPTARDHQPAAQKWPMDVGKPRGCPSTPPRRSKLVGEGRGPSRHNARDCKRAMVGGPPRPRRTPVPRGTDTHLSRTQARTAAKPAGTSQGRGERGPGGRQGPEACATPTAR